MPPITFHRKNSAERTICVGTVTRDRPEMLSWLLQSYLRLMVPDGVHLHFIVVENNRVPTIDQAIQTFREQIPQSSVHYELETRPGIAFARNRVLEVALAAGGDILTFVDDDEMVEDDWLVQLLCRRDSQDFDIIASPVRLAPPPINASFWNRLVWSGMDRINRNGEARSVRMLKRGNAGQIKLATGSWMAKLDFFRRTELRFDNSLALAGGEDWQLWNDALKLGAHTSWTPLPIAYETVPIDRLTLRYQYRRSRDHSSISVRGAQARPQSVLKVLTSILGRLWILVFCVIAAPLTRGRTLVRAAASFGSIVGLLRRWLGHPSLHYRRISGS